MKDSTQSPRREEFLVEVLKSVEAWLSFEGLNMLKFFTVWPVKTIGVLLDLARSLIKGANFFPTEIYSLFFLSLLPSSFFYRLLLNFILRKDGTDAVSESPNVFLLELDRE